ncbi:MAG: bifunctional diaminohydroxyphosphoribosylaminopyrimidine deaminase/5-amino-6-(5-phosphoribosylamino)uracil reductase RibD [Deltaproteobacteria bacterium]|nr:MAG: bifunctional diaminohydroxyphosphoribosylaminopyrimidine deaminase/5-amino-6-(5-phosphoribosylamino)uracil reductase RibD [Deltaproteobacteria bacterium]
MKQALAQARHALGRAFPNPAVGAIVFRGARVLGRGYTRPPGGPHAEIVALRRARRRVGERGLHGATLAVTLEPCCFTGRTGPCTDALIEARVGRVLIGQRDPHPRVRGRGIRRLRAAGIEVSVGVLGDACREQHRGFFSAIERGRPYVSLKLAATLDGRNATARGESRWITGAAARAWVHRLRSRSDAVMVGSGTVLADDPDLSARRAGRVVHRPVRVLVDSALRVPPSARLYRTARRHPTWVLCTHRAAAQRGAVLERRGARVLVVPAERGKLRLPAALARLAAEGLTTVLVEGGGGLASALLRARQVDELYWLVSGKLLGADAVPALAELGVARLREALALDRPRVRRLGEDLLIAGRLAPSGHAQRTGRGG